MESEITTNKNGHQTLWVIYAETNWNQAIEDAYRYHGIERGTMNVIAIPKSMVGLVGPYRQKAKTQHKGHFSHFAPPN